MKNIYLILFSCLLFSGCSKDNFKRYEKRIIGTWDLFDVDRNGIGGSISHQIFQRGTFTFREDHTVTYILDGLTYNGGWDINRYTQSNNCYTDDNGFTQCTDEVINALFISVTEPASQYNRTESFDNMVFRSSDRFNAYISADFKTYVFKFSKQ